MSARRAARGDRSSARRMGSATGTSRVSSGMAATAIVMPTTPPAADEQRGFRSAAGGPAVRVRRRAPSGRPARRRRPRTRARSRLARLVHAMSSTESDAPKSAVSSSLVCGGELGAQWDDRRPGPEVLLRVARARAARRSTVSSAAGLLDRDTGLELGHHLEVVVGAVVEVRGLEPKGPPGLRCERLGNEKSGGITPMTV